MIWDTFRKKWDWIPGLLEGRIQDGGVVGSGPVTGLWTTGSGGFNGKCAPWAQVVELWVSSLWCCLGRWYSLAGGSASLEVGFESWQLHPT